MEDRERETIITLIGSNWRTFRVTFPIFSRSPRLGLHEDAIVFTLDLIGLIRARWFLLPWSCDGRGWTTTDFVCVVLCWFRFDIMFFDGVRSRSPVFIRNWFRLACSCWTVFCRFLDCYCYLVCKARERDEREMKWMSALLFLASYAAHPFVYQLTHISCWIELLFKILRRNRVKVDVFRVENVGFRRLSANTAKSFNQPFWFSSSRRAAGGSKTIRAAEGSGWLCWIKMIPHHQDCCCNTQ